MDQDTLRRIQHVLNQLLQSGSARVGFLLNANGRLIAHVGSSPGFHPQARFTDPGNEDPGENVFMTGIDDAYIVGAVFSDPVTMEHVREAVSEVREPLSKLLAPYMRG